MNMEKLYKLVNGERVELSTEERDAFLTQTEDADMEWKADAWLTHRKNEYGSWQQQLDEIFHDVDAWKERIQSIKDNYPKGVN